MDRSIFGRAVITGSWSYFHRFVWIGLSVWNAVAASAQAPANSTIWELDDLATLQGLPFEVWGAPRVSLESGKAFVRFDGDDDALILPTIPISGWKRFTIEIHFSPDRGGPPEQRFLHLQDHAGRRALIELRLSENGQWCLDSFLYSDAEHRRTLIDRTKLHPAGEWHWAAVTYADGKMAHYVDGVKECEGEVEITPLQSPGKTSIGVRQTKISWFKGAIREIRFTPDALSSDKLQR